MQPTLEQLGIDLLTTDERIFLAHEILRSVVADRDAPSLTPDQALLIDERLARYEANPGIALDWEQVLAATRARLQS
jgi:putative addiction module component (TIGR02574 family)